MAILKSFLRDEGGATAIEYGLIAAGISVAIITVVSQLGSSLTTTLGSVKNARNWRRLRAPENGPSAVKHGMAEVRSPARANCSAMPPGL
jgi:pilus assembly protein Flp/PilA